MEPSVYGLILLILMILIGSACCSGVEAAFLAVNSIRILELASKKAKKFCKSTT
jgi:Mg2+/Co2+ transporter CorB